MCCHNYLNAIAINAAPSPTDIVELNVFVIVNELLDVVGSVLAAEDVIPPVSKSYLSVTLVQVLLLPELFVDRAIITLFPVPNDDNVTDADGAKDPTIVLPLVIGVLFVLFNIKM